jgi:DNA-binding Lrp family transcriptional regulator
VTTQPDWALQAVPERPKTTWNAAELMAVSFPEPTWAVPGIIAEGVTLLAGPPKVGKSWMSLGLGLSIAAGLSALGSVAVESGPVLYLALEDTPRRLQSRMRTVLAGHPAPSTLTLDTYCPPLPTGGDQYIAGWLDENPGARLVVIDVFTKVRGTAPAGLNSAYEADYAAVTRVKRLADTYAVPIVLVHHVRKAAAEDFLATVSGTNGLAGAADAVLVLERARAQADGILHVTGRDVDETDYAMSFDPSVGAWSLLDGPADEHLMQDTRALISRYVREYPGNKPAQIAEALQLKAPTVRQTCKRMADDGQIRAASGGAYFPMDPSDGRDAQPVSQLSLRHSSASDQGEQQ